LCTTFFAIIIAVVKRSTSFALKDGAPPKQLSGLSSGFQSTADLQLLPVVLTKDRCSGDAAQVTTPPQFGTSAHSQVDRTMPRQTEAGRRAPRQIGSQEKRCGTARSGRSSTAQRAEFHSAAGGVHTAQRAEFTQPRHEHTDRGLTAVRDQGTASPDTAPPEPRASRAPPPDTAAPERRRRPHRCPPDANLSLE